VREEPLHAAAHGCCLHPFEAAARRSVTGSWLGAAVECGEGGGLADMVLGAGRTSRGKPEVCRCSHGRKAVWASRGHRAWLHGVGLVCAQLPAWWCWCADLEPGFRTCTSRCLDKKRCLPCRTLCICTPNTVKGVAPGLTSGHYLRQQPALYARMHSAISP
jgi:hypothetical protein